MRLSMACFPRATLNVSLFMNLRNSLHISRCFVIPLMDHNHRELFLALQLPLSINSVSIIINISCSATRTLCSFHSSCSSLSLRDPVRRTIFAACPHFECSVRLPINKSRSPLQSESDCASACLVSPPRLARDGVPISSSVKAWASPSRLIRNNGQSRLGSALFGNP